MADLPNDTMEMEADIFLVFTGFNASTTASMSLSELIRWHQVALKRHEQAQQQSAS